MKNRVEESKHNNKALPNQAEMYEQIGIAFTQWLDVGKSLESPQKKHGIRPPKLKKDCRPRFQRTIDATSFKRKQAYELGQQY